MPGTLIQRHAAQFDAWLAGAGRDHYFIQLMARDAAHNVEIEAFLARAANSVDPELLRVYRSALSGHDRIGVIYGDYPTSSAAWDALRKLPADIQLLRPYPRQVSKLQR